MINLNRINLIVVASLTVLSISTQAQPSFQTRSQRELLWLNEAWTGKEAPWKALRQSCELEISKSQDRDQLLQSLESKAKKAPRDSKSQYRWAYTVYQSAVDGSSLAERMVSQASDALSMTPSPKVYEFTRLRFSLAAKQFPNPRLRGVGERLAKQDPLDYAVKYRLVKIIDPGLSSKDKQQALMYAQDLIRLQPNRASAHAALASVYLKVWLLRKDPQDGEKGAASYKRYLQLAPKNDPFRPQAERLITLMSAKPKE